MVDTHKFTAYRENGGPLVFRKTKKIRSRMRRAGFDARKVRFSYQKRSTMDWDFLAMDGVRVKVTEFHYQAEKWNNPRRVVCKVEWHVGEPFPRVLLL